MNPHDRERLEALHFSVDVIERTEDVLRVWEFEDLFTRCSYCGQVCYNPDLSRRQYRRKKLPADLFLKRELLGFRDHEGGVICRACDEEQFQS